MKWPKSLLGQLAVILAAGLVLSQALTALFVLTERSLMMRGVMVSYLAADVASSVAMLDRLPAAERQAWLPRLQRSNYQLTLDNASPIETRAVNPSALAQAISESLSQALSQTVKATASDDPAMSMRAELRLQDGTPVAVEVFEPRLRLSPWLLAALCGQLLALLACCWFAVRQVTQPVTQLATAAQQLIPGQSSLALPLIGPSEVVEATDAFNRMRERIDEHLAERSQMLGAISHDLQTPITRMRLRAELLEDEALKNKLHADLGQMQHLVEQGLAYARTSQALDEPEAPTDLLALLESVVDDYRDAAQPVQWLGGPALTLRTRPRALRRVLGNLIDNALKFGHVAKVSLSLQGDKPVILIEDDGPGIPVGDRDQVLKPFYRMETSRNPSTGGTGLGLAIVNKLAPLCAARLQLDNAPGGGLLASVHFGVSEPG